MSWLVRVVVPADEAELLISRLWDAGTTGVAELPSPDGSSERVELVAGFDEEPAAIQACGLAVGAIHQPLDPTAWEGPPLSQVSVGGHTIHIDAQQAFGHGAHPTTELVCDTLSALVGPGDSFLDVGTGTGVLAILAKKLGAGRVQAIDNDPAAISSAQANATTNEAEIEISATPLAELAQLVRKSPDTGRIDLVVANMLLADLRPLAIDLIEVTGETLVLSGFLDEQVDEILELFTPWHPVSRLDRDGWVCLVLR